MAKTFMKGNDVMSNSNTADLKAGLSKASRRELYARSLRVYVELESLLRNYGDSTNPCYARHIDRRKLLADLEFVKNVVENGQEFAAAVRDEHNTSAATEQESEQSRSARYRAEFGWALIAIGCYREAEAAFETAIRLDPSTASHHRGLAAAVNPKDKLPPLREATRLAPEDREAWIARGLAAHAAGEYAESVAAFDQVEQLKPGWLSGSEYFRWHWEDSRQKSTSQIDS